MSRLRRGRRLACVVVVLIAIASWKGTPSALGVDDTTAPELVDFSVSPSTVDSSGAPATITFVARITDDLSGNAPSGAVSNARFESPSGQAIHAFFADAQRVSGDALDGTYVFVATLPQFSEQGTWTLDSFRLVDQLGNVRELSYSDLISRGLPASFKNGPNSDNDGVPDSVEGAGPSSGDGNQDGIPDALQDNVSSLPNAVDSQYLTIEAPQYLHLENVTVTDPRTISPPLGAALPFGIVGFSVRGLDSGDNVSVRIIFPPTNVDTYFKFQDEQWVELPPSFITANDVTLVITDGGIGDDDATANGIIDDPGGPVAFRTTAPPASGRTTRRSDRIDEQRLTTLQPITAEPAFAGWLGSANPGCCAVARSRLVSKVRSEGGSITRERSVRSRTRRSQKCRGPHASRRKRW